MHRHHFTIFIFLLSISIMHAQQGSKLKDKGNAYYEKGQYAQAAEEYERYFMKFPDKEVALRLAMCYYKLNRNTQAEYYMKHYVATLPQADTTLLLYADILKKNNQHLLAKNQYIKLSTRFPHIERYATYVRYCDSAVKWLAKTDTKTQIHNLQKVNSPYSDITPVSYENGIVFSSNREEVLIKKKTGYSYTPLFDLYYAQLTDSVFSKKPSRFSSYINSVHNECCPSFTKENKKIFFTRSKDIQYGNVNTKNTLQLYSAHKQGNSWSDLHVFIFNDTTHSYGHPYIDEAEELFLFASDKAGGYGGTDLYVCFNIDGKWTDPVNMGPKINSPYNELYPFYHADGTLYFASNRPEGMGGYDLYCAYENENGDYDNVTNLKCPFNSPQDDICFYINAQKTEGYFSSNRDGGMGAEDIYRFFIRP